MVKLKSIKSEKIWGYENWIASVYPSMEQQELIEACGKDYSLLVKVIQANDTLSVQVHPNDKDAIDIEGNGFRGKTECWLVLDATPDATIVYGLKDKNYSSEQLKSAINDNSFEEYLNVVKVSKGDFIFIPAGTVHAIGGGLRLLEVQQSCDLTYRLYDWGRPREVHIEKGLKVISKEELPSIEKFDNFFECKYFALKKICVQDSFQIESRQETNAFSDYSLYFVLNGNGKVQNCLNEQIKLEIEDIILASKDEKLKFIGDFDLIQITAK